jgi:hypothetical protein
MSGFNGINTGLHGFLFWCTWSSTLVKRNLINPSLDIQGVTFDFEIRTEAGPDSVWRL